MQVSQYYYFIMRGVHYCILDIQIYPLYHNFRSQSCINRFYRDFVLIIAYLFFKNDIIIYHFLPLTWPYHGT